MESYEVLKKAVSGVGVKSVASDMNLSSAMVYRWCEANDSPDASGAKNPLDRVAKLCDVTGDRAPIKWLCHQVDGFFVQNTEVDDGFSGSVFEATQKMLKEFSDVLRSVTTGMRDDGKIDRGEAEQLRTEWEELKSVAESFVVACERGEYRKEA
ncbi:MAG: hypothetical protein HQ523_09300 [Lentisphaerae bacterium]|nr:hypothetical protein [Lentisphaerota bacterium]